MEATILLQNKEYESLFEKMDFEVAANPDDYWIAFESGWYQALVGDREKAANLLSAKDSTLSPEDKYDMPLCSPAIEIAWAYKSLGQFDTAQKITNECNQRKETQLQSGVDYHELHYLAARIEALNGNPEASLNHLENAINKGWREWWTLNDPLLSALFDMPKFKQLNKFIDDDLAKQRQQTLEFYRATTDKTD